MAFYLTGITQADGNDKIAGRGLMIIRQRLKFDNYLVNVCENTIDQILLYCYFMTNSTIKMA